MKLRNKKTGEIKSIEEIIKDAFLLNEVDSLKNIGANWEDYRPTKPLIKDEKARKAVRAWAEANDITEIVVFDCNNGTCLKVNELEFAENGGRATIMFKTNEKIDTDRRYTIEELCGEEETCER